MLSDGVICGDPIGVEVIIGLPDISGLSISSSPKPKKVGRVARPSGPAKDFPCLLIRQKLTNAGQVFGTDLVGPFLNHRLGQRRQLGNLGGRQLETQLMVAKFSSGTHAPAGQRAQRQAARSTGPAAARLAVASG